MKFGIFRNILKNSLHSQRIINFNIDCFPIGFASANKRRASEREIKITSTLSSWETSPSKTLIPKVEKRDF